MSELSNNSTRRELRFQSLAELSSELDRIEQAEQNGVLQTIGNWSPSQILGHLGAWIHYGWEGYPMKPPPWFVRWFLRWQLPKMLEKGMPPGVRIPGIPGGTTATEEMDFGAALANLRNGIERLDRGEEALHHSPAFGPMSYQDRIRLNLRHAELHLGFMRFPGDSTAELA